MNGKYSFFNMLKIYRDNRHEVDAYFKGQPIEGFHGDNKKDKNDAFASFGGIALFMVFLLIGAGIWIWALVATIKYWSQLPIWAQIIAVIGLVTGVGPVVTLIVVYIGKGTTGGSKFSDYYSPQLDSTPQW